MKVDAGGDFVEEMRGGRVYSARVRTRMHARRGEHTSRRRHTCLKVRRGVKIRKREGERGDCSTKEARERANQWRHDNELFPRQRGS